MNPRATIHSLNMFNSICFVTKKTLAMLIESVVIKLHHTIFFQTHGPKLDYLSFHDSLSHANQPLHSNIGLL
jgi:hypothetical protein